MSLCCSTEGHEDRPARRGRLCWACLKREQRGGLRVPTRGLRYRTVAERLVEVAIAIADASDVEPRELDRAIARLKMSRGRGRKSVHGGKVDRLIEVAERILARLERAP